MKATLTVLLVALLSVSAQSQSLLDRYDAFIYSRPAQITFGSVFVTTTAVLIVDWRDLEGIRQPTDEHAYWGTIGYAVGGILRWKAPRYYRENFGLRLATSIFSPLTFGDDVFQHLWLQQRDGWYKGMPGSPADSPIGAYYHWALQKERQNENFVILLFDAKLPWWKLSFSVGHAQGPFVGLNQELYKPNKYIEFSASAIATTGWNKKTRVSIKSVITGIRAKIYIIPDKVALTAVTGYQFRLGELENRWITLYGISIR